MAENLGSESVERALPSISDPKRSEAKTEREREREREREIGEERENENWDLMAKNENE